MLVDYLDSRVLTGPGCWEWLAHRNHDGYGRACVSGVLKMAHRVVYELSVGPIPDGLQLHHKCKNRGCVNPGHLTPVTHRENMKDRDCTTNHRNRVKTHCPLGHVLDYVRPDGKGRGCTICRKKQSAERKR